MPPGLPDRGRRPAAARVGQGSARGRKRVGSGSAVGRAPVEHRPGGGQAAVKRRSNGGTASSVNRRRPRCVQGVEHLLQIIQWDREHHEQATCSSDRFDLLPRRIRPGQRPGHAGGTGRSGCRARRSGRRHGRAGQGTQGDREAQALEQTRQEPQSRSQERRLNLCNPDTRPACRACAFGCSTRISIANSR